MNQKYSASLFGSRTRFQAIFEQGLDRLLQAGDLNLFILVLANASFDQQLFDRLRPGLFARYRQLTDELAGVSPTAATQLVAADDLAVFEKISAIGLERLAVTRKRSAGPWEVQFNQLRSLRPMRNSQRPVVSIREPFDESGFHFNKPFMQQETIWSGHLLGRQIDLYYNKYPFVDLHALLVPDRQACLPQFLGEEIHTYVFELVRFLGATMPGIRVGYNGFGAFASVNHLHLQLFARSQPLPVEAGRWRHNGGAVAYPSHCRVFDDPASAWAMISRLHEHNLAYNLLYTPERVYCMPRKKQGEFELADWSNGFSWYEMSGGMITYDRETCMALAEPVIAADLARARLDKLNV